MKNIKPSRQRRNDAVNAARKAVYDNSGLEYSDSLNIYDVVTNERQHRIFKKYYISICNKYHFFEDILNSM